MSTPILTDGLIERTLEAERCRMVAHHGVMHRHWSLGTSTALTTLTPEGWCQIGWIDRSAQAGGGGIVRYRVWWHVDTGEVRCTVDGELAANPSPRQALGDSHGP